MVNVKPEPETIDWRTHNPAFNMMSNGKKLKKKARKLLKSKNKVSKATLK